jgi:hypothetical protein
VAIIWQSILFRCRASEKKLDFTVAAANIKPSFGLVPLEKTMLRIKQRPLQLGAIGLAVTALALGLAACSGGSETAAPVEVVTSPPVAVLTSVAKYQLVLRNAATGALITDPTTVTLSGVNLVNLTGGAVTSLTVTDGLASFATAPGVAAGGTLAIATQSRAAGWADGSTSVNVQALSDVQVITLSLTNTNRVAEIPTTAPIAAAVASVPVTGGVVTAAIQSSTPAKTVTSVTGAAAVLPTATVNIPANTRITNAAGQTPTNPITLVVVTPALNTADGQAQIPGGGQDAGGPTDVAGMLTATLQDAAGNRYTNFSSPVKVTMPMVSGALKFDGSGPLAVGDLYPISTWNAATREWVFSADGLIKQGTSGLVAEFEVSSFSTKGAAGPRITALRPGYIGPPVPNTCAAAVTFTGRPAGNTQALTARITRTNGTPGGFTQAIAGTANSFTRTLTFYNPVAFAANVRVTDANGVELANTNLANLCSAQNTIALNFPAAPTGSINVSTREQCASGSNNRALPNAAVTAVAGSNVRSASSDGAGASTIANLPAGTYTVTPSGMTNRTTPAAQTVVVGAGAVNANFVYTAQCATGTGGG